VQISSRHEIGATQRPPAIAYVSMFLFGLLVAAGAKSLGDFAIEANHREMLRVTSPDGRVDAVFVRPAISYFGDFPALYLVAKGDAAPAWGPLLRVSRFGEPPRLVWKNAQLLEYQFARGCIHSFSNLWHSNDVEHGRYYVEIGLEPATRYSCIAEPGRGAPAASSAAGAVNGAALR
jgi:hypothetical protein